MSRCFPNLKMIILDHWDENKKSVTWRIERKIYLLCSNKEKHHPHEIERLNYWYQPLIETIEFCNSCCHHRSCNLNKLMLNVYTYICIIFIFPPGQTVFFLMNWYQGDRIPVYILFFVLQVIELGWRKVKETKSQHSEN